MNYVRYIKLSYFSALMPILNPTPLTKGKTIVYLIRHGDRDGKIEGAPRIPGPPLSELGKKQAHELARVIAHLKPEVDVLYTSFMTRAYETAQPVEKVLGKKAKRITLLSELPRHLTTKPFWHYLYWKARWHRIKAIRTFRSLLKKHPEKVIVIVAHGRLIKHLMGDALGLSIKQAETFDYHNCHITKLRFKGTDLDYIHYFNSAGLPGKGLSITHKRLGSSV